MNRFLKMIQFEAKAFFKDYPAMFFTIALPLLLLYLFGTAYGSTLDENGIRGIDQGLAIDYALLIANIGFIGLPMTVSEVRQSGFLKRIYSYPSSVFLYYLSIMIVFLSCGLLSGILVYFLAIGSFQAVFAGVFYEFVLACIVGAGATLGIGFFISSLNISARVTNTVCTTLFMISIFASGIIIPLDTFPKMVGLIFKWLPVNVMIEFFKSIWSGTGNLFQGDNLQYFIYLLTVSILFWIMSIVKKVSWDSKK